MSMATSHTAASTMNPSRIGKKRLTAPKMHAAANAYCSHVMVISLRFLDQRGRAMAARRISARDAKQVRILAALRRMAAEESLIQMAEHLLAEFQADLDIARDHLRIVRERHGS